MKAIKKKQLILTLLKNDLLNARLVFGLNALGLEAGEYLLNRSPAVLQLLGYRKEQISDEPNAYYQDLLERAKYLRHTEDRTGLDALATEMYGRLKSAAKTRQWR